MPPPPPGIGGVLSFSFFSTTTHSVVSSRPAMDAAFCSAVRVTLVGSMTPGHDQVLVLVGLGVVAVAQLRRLLHLAHDDRALGARVLGDHADRLLERAPDDIDAGLLVFVGAPDLVERPSGTTTAPHRRPSRCPPRRRRGSRAARPRPGPSFPSFRSRSPRPTLMTATPPASLASRSCSFSLS